MNKTYNILEPRKQTNERTRDKKEQTQCSWVALPLRQSARMIWILVFSLVVQTIYPIYTVYVVLKSLNHFFIMLYSFSTPSRCTNTHQSVLRIFNASSHLTILFTHLAPDMCMCVYCICWCQAYEASIKMTDTNQEHTKTRWIRF